MTSRYACVCFLVLSGAITYAFSGVQQPERKTVWMGVYTEAQAERGSQEYLTYCSPCHGVELEGVANLKGPDFMERWREFDVRAIYEFMSQSMPRPRRGSPYRPGSLSETTYLSILAHIFRSNSFPAGSEELTTAVMKNIQIEEKDGPKPVPNGALIQTIGCLTRRGSEWFLTNAAEPVRTSTSTSSTEEEMQNAKAKALGQLRFALFNFGFLGADFDPTVFVGHRMQTKGFLVRQPPNNRINLTSLESIGTNCQ